MKPKYNLEPFDALIFLSREDWIHSPTATTTLTQVDMDHRRTKEIKDETLRILRTTNSLVRRPGWVHSSGRNGTAMLCKGTAALLTAETRKYTRKNSSATDGRRAELLYHIPEDTVPLNGVTSIAVSQMIQGTVHEKHCNLSADSRLPFP
jgi:hypothetical protein